MSPSTSSATPRASTPRKRPDGLEGDQGALRVAGQVAQLHIALGDHDLEGFTGPAIPHGDGVGAGVLAVGRQHCGRGGFQQRPHRFDPRTAPGAGRPRRTSRRDNHVMLPVWFRGSGGRAVLSVPAAGHPAGRPPPRASWRCRGDGDCGGNWGGSNGASGGAPCDPSRRSKHSRPPSAGVLRVRRAHGGQRFVSGNLPSRPSGRGAGRSFRPGSPSAAGTCAGSGGTSPRGSAASSTPCRGLGSRSA
jgi:hypothetical protein